jgi:hypothetical protein
LNTGDTTLVFQRRDNGKLCPAPEKLLNKLKPYFEIKGVTSGHTMLEKLLKNRHIKRIIIWLQQTMLLRGRFRYMIFCQPGP